MGAVIMGAGIPGPLGMGGAPLGNLFEQIDESVADATLQAAWDSGVRHFDTAPHYGAGLSELRIGAALRSRDRNAFWLSTKVGRRLAPTTGAADPDQGFVGELPFRRIVDFSADGTVRSIEDSLARLGLARIDAVFIHDVSEDHLGARWTRRFEEAMKGAAPVLTEMRRRGEIKAWGLGVNLVEPCLAALEHSAPDLFLIAGQYSLLRHTALERLFPACAERGVRVVVGGPYNSGLLAGGTTFDYRQAPTALATRAAALQAACARYDVDLRAAALQFCAAHPVVAAVIPGARTPEEVRSNWSMMQAAIPDALWSELRRSGFLPDEAPVPRQDRTRSA